MLKYKFTLISLRASTFRPFSGSPAILAASEKAGHRGFHPVRVRLKMKNEQKHFDEIPFSFGTSSSLISKLSSRLDSSEACRILCMILRKISSFIFFDPGVFLFNLSASVKFLRISSAHLEMSAASAFCMSILAFLMLSMAVSTLSASFLRDSSSSSVWMMRRKSKSSVSRHPYSSAMERSLEGELVGSDDKQGFRPDG